MRDDSTIKQQWTIGSRWEGIMRPYTSEDVAQLSGSIQIEHTLARLGAERLWWLLHNESFVPALGALTGNQAVQQVQAGLKAIYLSGSQVAADANDAGQMYPDQSLYPANSVPQAKKISAGFARLKANGWRFSEIPAQCFVARRPPLGWKNMRTPSV